MSASPRVPPYDRAMLALCLSTQQAQGLGFTGTDADLLTPDGGT